ncbi:hypothetical protein ACFFJT_09810 [Dyella flava]|uniref:Uncharacterized protein n=1 Tax=Dyella flava TaxID=1920170 RepID=A0ABS2KAJ0_9GAMM|nr:hypothetical protein [Dyella flava]MBM7127888.1 hypothetical protein [Dyella flava]
MKSLFSRVSAIGGGAKAPVTAGRVDQKGGCTISSRGFRQHIADGSRIYAGAILPFEIHAYPVAGFIAQRLILGWIGDAIGSRQIKDLAQCVAISLGGKHVAAKTFARQDKTVRQLALQWIELKARGIQENQGCIQLFENLCAHCS